MSDPSALAATAGTTSTSKPTAADVAPAAGDKSVGPSKKDKQEYAAAARAYLLRHERTNLG